MVDVPKIVPFVYCEDPFVLSDQADQASIANPPSPEEIAYFEQREVLEHNAAFPNGEGFLYSSKPGDRGCAPNPLAKGKPGVIDKADDPGNDLGTKKGVQQDSFGQLRIKVGNHEAAVLIAADGVTNSKDLARPASQKAVDVFMENIKRDLTHAPSDESARHRHIEDAMVKAATYANFEIVRQVLMDLDRDGDYDVSDRARLREKYRFDLPEGPVSLEQMRELTPALDMIVRVLRLEDSTALTTFSVAIAIDNDLYTFNSGDSVIGLFRPTRENKKFIHLTERDQAVVRIYKDRLELNPKIRENSITDSMGNSGQVTGTLRRYPNLLQPGDTVIAATDGLGLRSPDDDGDKRGMTREMIERVLSNAKTARDAALGLVRGQMHDLPKEKYQDNIAIVALKVV